jgi:hypothetical protein
MMKSKSGHFNPSSANRGWHGMNLSHELSMTSVFPFNLREVGWAKKVHPLPTQIPTKYRNQHRVSRTSWTFPIRGSEEGQDYPTTAIKDRKRDQLQPLYLLESLQCPGNQGET